MKTSKTTSLLLALICSLSVSAQWWGNKKVRGEGPVQKENRTVTSFDALSIAGSFEVVLVQGAEGSVTIEAQENLLPYITTEVRNGNLRIGTEDNVNLQPEKQIHITVQVTDVEKISLAGSGTVVSDFTLTGESLHLRLAGSGDMDISAETHLMEADLAGSGDIIMKGSATRAEINIAGSGDIEAFDLKANDTSVNISGSGTAQVYCDGYLDAKIIGSGDVVYKGSPKKEDSKSIGSGKIRKWNN